MANPQAAQAAQQPAYRRSARNYLLNLRYQLKYTLTMVVISAVLTGGLGYFVVSNAHEASRVVQVRAMDPTDPFAAELAAQFAANDRVTMLILILFGITMCLVLTAYGIVITHRVAGPLFKVAKHLDEIRDGKLGAIRDLRKGDELVDFFEHFKGAHDALRRRTEEDIALYDKAIAQAGDPTLKADLEKARQRKADALK